MDLLHEELKEPVMEIEDVHPTSVEENMEEDKSQSDLDFQSCESCNSSDKAENEASYKPLMEDPAESAMLIQDDENHSLVCKDWQKEKILCNKLNRTNSMEVLEKDTHSTSETAEFLNNQGTVKVQIHSRLSGDYIKQLMCNCNVIVFTEVLIEVRMKILDLKLSIYPNIFLNWLIKVSTVIMCLLLLWNALNTDQLFKNYNGWKAPDIFLWWPFAYYCHFSSWRIQI